MVEEVTQKEATTTTHTHMTADCLHQAKESTIRQQTNPKVVHQRIKKNIPEAIMTLWSEE
jgi:hypothetical protein